LRCFLAKASVSRKGRAFAFVSENYLSEGFSFRFAVTFRLNPSHRTFGQQKTAQNTGLFIITCLASAVNGFTGFLQSFLPFFQNLFKDTQKSAPPHRGGA